MSQVETITNRSVKRFLSKIPKGDYVGVAGAYSPGDRKLTHLALSSFDLVVCISLNPKDGDSSQRVPEETTRILSEVLNDTFGEHSKFKFLAFDGERIAVGLWNDWGVRTNLMLHLQTLAGGGGKKTFVRTIFHLFEPGGYVEADRDDLTDAFEDDNSLPDWKKRLKFRASSSYYMQRLHAEAICEAFEGDMYIRTAGVSDANLSNVATSARTTERIGSLQPAFVANDHRSADIDRATGEVKIELDRFKTRTHSKEDDQVSYAL
ncbi:uncharacterized protein EI90DRAFT_780602 [Cantharellus anzutake]|uniref:uncharacterized protein n=1 Tax=Cantharellus anzutake TaxID=1750568 RepID=UPI001902EC18|nr:uncharacterized protein EI90DRAFT_780602 [Cantharellus anzutake]KAF8342728.1 hypothetical protein EI90DRAFT_780602 [Cantharellus anzutake]